MKFVLIKFMQAKDPLYIFSRHVLIHYFPSLQDCFVTNRLSEEQQQQSAYVKNAHIKRLVQFLKSNLIIMSSEKLQIKKNASVDFYIYDD